MYLLYNTLLILLSPFVLGYAIVRDLSRIGIGRLPERLGRTGLSHPPIRPCVWIHAASVGETMAAAPIVASLYKQRPGVSIVFSNITATGHETALQVIPGAKHIYFPFDIPRAIRRALQSVQPDVCVTVETELWPNFIHLSRARGARICLVNGRISDRSFRRASLPFIRPLFSWMMRGLDRLGMQTEADAARARELGALPARTVVLGNTKFDQSFGEDPPAEDVAREMALPAGAPTIVAGSTHAGEDEAVLDAFLTIRQAVPDARLILAPRRLERVPSLKAALQTRNLQARFRSEELHAAHLPSSRLLADTPVFILDTLGELRRVYALARVAFVGGTLVPVGGHDLLQPLAKGKPVLFGPHIHNTREIAAAALECGAAVRVASSTELEKEAIRLLQGDAAARMGEAGRTLIDANRGAAARYAACILELIDVQAGSQG